MMIRSDKAALVFEISTLRTRTCVTSFSGINHLKLPDEPDEVYADDIISKKSSEKIPVLPYSLCDINAKTNSSNQTRDVCPVVRETPPERGKSSSRDSTSGPSELPNPPTTKQKAEEYSEMPCGSWRNRSEDLLTFLLIMCLVGTSAMLQPTEAAGLCELLGCGNRR